jgi:diguanylate cyclase (GGDEF)-like protein
MTGFSMARLIEVFARESHERIAESAQFLDALERDAGDARAVEELMRRFHGFAGIGGFEGFELVNSAGARAESECRKLMKAGEAPAAQTVRRWRTMITFIENEVNEIQRAWRNVIVMPTEADEEEETRPVRRVYDVLLVEDDADVHALLGPRLVAEGFNVRSVYTHEDAMSAMSIPPHALIVDVGLPDGSGYEVVSALRSIPERENAPVFIISARESFRDKVEGIRSGADAYFRKPLDCEALIRRLRSLVESRDDSVARILSVEDDPAQSAYLHAILEGAGYEVRSCADPKHFESELLHFNPHLIVMDILIPGVSGYELARFARQLDEHQTTPILFLTSEREMHTRIESMRSGGDEHIEKPVSANLLLAAVEARLQRSRQIRHFLDHDSLTGLYNRTAFTRRAQAWLRGSDGGDSAALVMIDVDRFKAINDQHGHAYGDQVLSRLGSFLRNNVRVSDVVSRYGGEEFAMLVDDVSESEVVRLVDRLREEFASMQQATFSAGVALISHRSSFADSMRAADAALYRAKASGRNCVVTAAAGERIDERMKVAS